MKLKAICGNCRHERVFEVSVINMNNEACPACNQPFRYSGYTTIGVYDETALTPDVIRAIIREELKKY